MSVADAIQEAVERRLRGLDGVVVAFSGGVDSSLVCALAQRALGDRALAVTAASPALASGELDGARRVAAAVGIAHEVVPTDELAREAYRLNGPDRCYHCKTELYEVLVLLADRRGYAALASGANADDGGDWRPGLTAAAERGVVHPLLEAGAGKDVVRELAARLGVPSSSKPASPCLASRIPYGTEVNRDVLRRVDRAEAAVRRLGYGDLRVRHHGARARVELPAADLGRVDDPAERRALLDAVRSAGYASAAIDPEPFRSGSLNRAAGLTAPGAARDS